MTRYINNTAFFISFAIGILYNYIVYNNNDVKIIVKYPTLYDDNVYRDMADVCYKFNKESVTCPADKTKIKYYNFG
jgi:hypothetical protein